jgi:hypothetical protein
MPNYECNIIMSSDYSRTEKFLKQTVYCRYAIVISMVVTREGAAGSS